MKKVLIYGLVALWAMTGLSSCEDLLDATPKQSIDSEEAFQSFDDVQAALIGSYSVLKSSSYYGRDYIIVSELLGDNMKIHTKNSNRFVSEQNNMPGAHVAIWNSCYTIINRVNNIMANIDKFSNPNDASFENKKSKLKAEALFLRSLAYFDLVRSYCREPQYGFNVDLGVPIVEKSVKQISDVEYPTRNTVAEVYKYIEDNLTAAVTAMETATTGDNRVASSGPYQASLASIKGLQARVYLFQNKWQLAADAAQDAIDESGLSLANGGNEYYKIFAENKESIWTLRWTVESESLGFDCLASIQNKLSGSGYGDAILRNDMLNQYNLTKPSSDQRTWTSNDARYSVVKWGKRTSSDVLIPWNIKYNSWKGSFGMDDIPMMRVSEMVLIKSEALAELGDIPGALEQVNKIRSRAGLPDLTIEGLTLVATAQTKTLEVVTMEAIMKEKRIELAFEGFRYWDLKRKQMDITKGISTDYGKNEAKIPWNDFRVVARIPVGEIDVNKNLKQNPGY